MTAIPRSRYAVFVIVAALGFLADQATKTWMFAWLGPPGGPTYWVIDSYFGFQTSLNRGALWGLGQGQVWLFASLSVVAALGIVYWLFVVGEARDRLLTWSLAAVMAGVLGNLVDRLGLWRHAAIPVGDRHAVRDWILFTFGSFTWPNFNIADSLLVCGAALLAWHALVHSPEARAK